ncbi:MAG: hypothetical protein QOE70_1479 [Chthoniobacter sp.]|nr:hypothetical protein [Chthoniobacter sp.]
MKPLCSAARIWVLPNRNTVGLLAVLAGMWYAGASQNNGAAYLLCFVLTAVALVSILHAWANLRGLILEADPIRPVFAGEERVVPLQASSARHRAHFGIRVKAGGAEQPAVFPHLEAEGAVVAELRVPARQRGFFETLPVCLESRFPLGFFTARQFCNPAQAHFVYPEPVGSRPLPSSLQPARHARDGLRAEGDDFGGVRSWRPGESQRHIDWKAAARGQPLLIKQWSGDSDDTQALDWNLLAGLDTETRLSQLARWVVLAERAGSSYGLALPGVTLPPSRGEAHYHACLRLLAQFAPRLGAADAPADCP